MNSPAAHTFASGNDLQLPPPHASSHFWTHSQRFSVCDDLEPGDQGRVSVLVPFGSRRDYQWRGSFYGGLDMIR
jgi:hypothetical protein